jgi:hypothetical protein
MFFFNLVSKSHIGMKILFFRNYFAEFKKFQLFLINAPNIKIWSKT